MRTSRQGLYHKIKTYASGKRVRLTLDDRGRIIESKPIAPALARQVHRTRTKTRNRLTKKKRRLGL